MQIPPVGSQLALSWALVVVACAQVLLAVALTYMTWLYARRATDQTAALQAVQEALAQSRTAAYRPVLKGSIVLTGDSEFAFALVNTGQGAAHEVDAEWSIDGGAHTSTWAASYIAPGERHRFQLRLGDEEGAIRTQTTTDRPIDSAQAIRQHLSESPGILTYTATCEDPLGNSYEFGDEIPLKALVSKRTENAIEVVE